LWGEGWGRGKTGDVMKKIVVASTNKNAGKTSLIIGLAKASGNKIAYLKPLGDRLLYQKKRQWDYDSAIMTNLIGIQETPEDITIGFEHLKLRYMYDNSAIKTKLNDMLNSIKDRDIVFLECGKNFSFGNSISLDPISIAKYIEGTLIVVTSGNDDAILDNITYLKHLSEFKGIEFGGIVINKVHDKSEFENMNFGYLKETGINILGILPFVPELTYSTVKFITDKLFAKIIAGEEGLNNVIKKVVVGSMSANAVLNLPAFKSESKLVITSGDRSDMILAALQTSSSAILLTNNVIPPNNIIAKATEMKVPLLLVPQDTYEIAKQIDKMESLITSDDTSKAQMIGDLVKANIDMDKIFK